MNKIVIAGLVFLAVIIGTVYLFGMDIKSSFVETAPTATIPETPTPIKK
tara:strand:+ start:174 stop:320 length:147 start_codon:yes stop_codon:yes gene_type:complete